MIEDLKNAQLLSGEQLKLVGDDVAHDMLVQLVAKRIESLWHSDESLLLDILYRLDVAEDHVVRFQRDGRSEELALAILHRQQLRAAYRKGSK